ncbi:tripartite tricarboxylate transporter substrate binding protein [Reyranella sp. CPCC 100927]|uniref:Bug family tripartite tricarboxylate transporter substrate binding protein n=1 Tax=Reyranella sp. CPCC 100927 TaxID=2599616 RepID=UPI0011B4F06F|nr:tripartite tricarboxylate transporter substrate binding protein [Reyranella sp. CPCC 100927]TWT01262.1 tripartite tricarboxylate transporter substrate binding protein [Reyranella sp. CPCC 100927]
MPFTRRLFVSLIAAMAAAPMAAAQPYPARPITMIVPYPPGGVNDVVARAYADKLGQALGVSVIVDNKAGAATTLASNLAAKAAPDGYTIYAGGTSLVINPTLQGNVQYDPKKSFEPVSLMSVTPFILHVTAAFPPKDMKQLVAHVKANPGKFNIATSGIGAVNHMSSELFKSLLGLDIAVVPYRGGAQAGQDVAAGQAQMMFSAALEAVPLLQRGATRALAVSSATRSPAFPDLPTVEEALGIQGLATVFWQAMVVPAGTPKPVIDTLQAAIARIAADPDMKARFAQQGVELQSSTPQDLAALMDREEKRWSTLIKEKGIKAE